MTAVGLAAPSPRELDVLAEAREGDARAFELLIEPRLAGLLRTAAAILRDEDEARDAVQDAAIAAWRELPRLRNLDRFDAWLSRILVNACRMSLRERRRRPVVHDLLLYELGLMDRQPASAMGERAEAVDAIRRAFARLQPDERIVLALRYSEDRLVNDIARLMGISEGTVKWRLHEARRSLERQLEVELR